jgi:hypothetical protein
MWFSRIAADVKIAWDYVSSEHAVILRQEVWSGNNTS